MRSPAQFVLLLVVVGAVSAGTSKLPSYITACQRSSAEFQQCALASARAALPHIIQGDRKMRLPSLLPVRVTSLLIETPGAVRLKLRLSDIEIAGLDRLELKHLKVDLQGGKLEYVAWTPSWELLGHYDVSGQIILLPITGNGAINITLEDVFWSSSVSFVKETKPNEAEHLRVTNMELHSNHTHGSMHCDNLFNGDKLLGEQMNKIMNDNWSAMNEVVSPYLEHATAQVYRQVFDGIFSKVAFEELFPE